MGTNTFHILIAERSCHPLRIIHNEKRDVRLGKGGISKGLISDSAQKRALNALNDFRTIAEKYNIIPKAYGTSALRNATNQSEVVAMLSRETGIPISVIDGDQEASFIAAGVHAAYGASMTATNLIMDIGGGSVEFIITRNGTICWKSSFEIGIQRLKDLVNPEDPMTSGDMVAIEVVCNEILKSLLAACIEYQPTRLIGCAGTFDTLSSIFMQLGGSAPSTSGLAPFHLDMFEPIYRQLVGVTESERKQRFQLTDLRAEMIGVAVVLVRWIIQHCKLDEMEVSKYSMKEGILVKSLNCE